MDLPTTVGTPNNNIVKPAIEGKQVVNSSGQVMPQKRHYGDASGFAQAYIGEHHNERVRDW